MSIDLDVSREIFGWTKTAGPLSQTKFSGLMKVAAQTIFTFAAYNLTRMDAIFGWLTVLPRR